MEQADILVVEDDVTIARALQLELEHVGHKVRKVADGLDALKAVETTEPDLAILDLMLPGADGLDVARRVREAGHTFPILMLTARVETEDVVDGFAAGADDYLRKPFETPELLSRVDALLRRRPVSERTKFTASGVTVDTAARVATLGEETLSLTAREFDLLAYLLRNAGRVVPREEILEAVWRGQHASDSNVIEVFVCHLRNKIGDRDNTVIQTIRGVGYFFAIT